MEQGKRKSLKDLISAEELKKTLFASLMGDNNGNYNLFRVVRGGDAPLLTQRIYGYDK
jgi:hypothetical protein